MKSDQGKNGRARADLQPAEWPVKRKAAEWRHNVKRAGTQGASAPVRKPVQNDRQFCR